MQIAVCEQVLQLDYLVNVPVLKGHCQTGMTCALKNLKGCIPNREKRRSHSLGLHLPIAALNAIVRQDLVLVDGLCGDLNFEEGGHPCDHEPDHRGARPGPGRQLRRLPDGLFERRDSIHWLRRGAGGWLGRPVPRPDHALNDDLGTSKLPKIRSLGTLTRLIADLDACSACYGSLVHALERLREHGTLGAIRQPLRIGQRYKGQSCDGIGIGSCTAGCARPPAGLSAGRPVDFRFPGKPTRLIRPLDRRKNTASRPALVGSGQAVQLFGVGRYLAEGSRVLADDAVLNCLNQGIEKISIDSSPAAGRSSRRTSRSAKATRVGFSVFMPL